MSEKLKDYQKIEHYFTCEEIKFPAGENHIKFKPVNSGSPEIPPGETKILLTQRLNSSDDIIKLLLKTDALRRINKDLKIAVRIPYICFSRQDRVMDRGEAFSLKVFANLINSQNYEYVFCIDPHSDVSGALINNLIIEEPFYLRTLTLKAWAEFGEFSLIAPDGGALKKIYKQAAYLEYDGDILCASKVRNLTNGKIIRTEVESSVDKIENKTIVILDDIGSYCGTFMALAKVLKEKGAKNVLLMLSHYEGVADIAKLQESGIDKIYTTNSICDTNSDYIKQVSI